MTTRAQIPNNPNPLQNNKFTFVIPSIPNIVYFCQSVDLPGVTIDDIAVTSPYTNMHRSGDRLHYGTLDIVFIVDEDLRTWEEIYQWMKDNAFITNPSKNQTVMSETTKGTQRFADGLLSIHTANHTPNLQVKFYNIFPTAVGKVSFDTKDMAGAVTCSASFAYDFFEIVRNNS